MKGVRVNILTEHGHGDAFHRRVHRIDAAKPGCHVWRGPGVLEVANWGRPETVEEFDR